MKNLILTLILGVLFSSCGGDDSSSSSSPSSTQVSSAVYKGSAIAATSFFNTKSTFSLEVKRDENVNEWKHQFNSEKSTFIITGPSSIVVSGDYEVKDSGFLKLTVTASNNESTVPVGTEAYGLLIDGLAFLLKPLGEDTGIIPMLISGTCPDSDFSMNWIVTSNNSDITQCETAYGNGNLGLDITGLAEFNATDSTVELTNSWDICDNELRCSSFDGNQTLCENRGGCSWNVSSSTCSPSDGAMTYTCSEGTATVMGVNESGDPVTLAWLYLTNSGAAMIQTESESDSSVLLGFPKDTLTGSEDSLNGDYFGMVFIANEEDSVMPVNVEISGTTINVTHMNPDSGVDTGYAGTLTITNYDQPGTGFFTATLSVNESDTAAIHSYVQCTVDLDTASSGKNIINCVGQEPGESAIGNVKYGSDSMFSLMIISK